MHWRRSFALRLGHAATIPGASNKAVTLKLSLEGAVCSMSAIPPIASEMRACRDFRDVPLGDIVSARPYSIILSDRAITVGGTVMPILLATDMFIVSSNVTGCCIGKSAGLAPFKILST